MDRYVNVTEAAEYFSISRSTFYNHKNADPNFPKPLIFGQNSGRYHLGTLIKYFSEKSGYDIEQIWTGNLLVAH